MVRMYRPQPHDRTHGNNDRAGDESRFASGTAARHPLEMMEAFEKTFDAFTRRPHQGTLKTAGGYGHRDRLVSGTRNNPRPAGE
jgi:hypothetical protein